MAAENKPISTGSIDQILANPLTGLRIAVAGKFQKEGISAEDIATLISQLLQPGFIKDIAEEAVLKKEIANLETAISTGRAKQNPNLEYPSTQLLWNAAMWHIISNPGVADKWPAKNRASELEHFPLWKQIVNDNPTMKKELRELSEFIVGLSDDNSIRKAIPKWQAPLEGYPAVGFYYDPYSNPDKKLIACDPMWALNVGLEHARAAIMHEINHAEITVKYTPIMQRIREEVEPLEEKKNSGQKLTPEEYKRMALLVAEWNFRNSIYEEAENNPVDRRTVKLSERKKRLEDQLATMHISQDYGHSRNVVETIMCGAGQMVLDYRARTTGQEEETESAEAPVSAMTAVGKFENLTRAIRMSFFRNNGLFTDMDEGWKEVGVDRSVIEALPKKAGYPAPTNEQAFAELMELCGGPNGLEHLQPSFGDRLRKGFAEKIEAFADQRNAIIEDIFARYAEPIVREMLQEQEQQLDEQMQQQAEQDDQGQKNEGQGESGQGQSPGDAKEKEEKSDQKQDGQPGQEGEKEGDKGKESADKEQSGQSEAENKDEGQDGGKTGQDKSEKEPGDKQKNPSADQGEGQEERDGGGDQGQESDKSEKKEAADKQGKGEGQDKKDGDSQEQGESQQGSEAEDKGQQKDQKQNKDKGDQQGKKQKKGDGTESGP